MTGRSLTLPAGRIPGDPPYWTCVCTAVLDDDDRTREVHGLWHLLSDDASEATS